MQAGKDLKKLSDKEIVQMYRDSISPGSFDMMAAATAAGELYDRGWVIDDSGPDEIFIPPKAKTKAA